ncbi:MAG: NosD domain-containing protein [Methanosarcina sp.]
MRQMKGKCIIVFLVILAFYLITAGNAAAIAISVNNGAGQVANFTSIQAAVNAANPGDEIIVKPGTYEENIKVTKTLSIVSESGNFSNTIVRAANSSEDIFSIWANGVSIKGFSINGSSSAGIHFFGVIDCHIENNKLSNNGCGIDLYMLSSGNKINNNKISDSLTGISLGGSSYNNMSNNSISNCGNGISLFDSPNNKLENNFVSKNSEGVSLSGESNGNTLISNIVTLNKKLGLHIYETSNNLIYNNYFNNTVNVEPEPVSRINIWNTTKTTGTNIAGGSYLGGNLWAKPNGTVVYSEGVRDADLDGILDVHYNIQGSEFIDYLPLTESKPNTILVSNSAGQAADFVSIQAAVDNASPGDVVIIYPGIYRENIDVPVKNLTLISASGSPADTIVKGNSSEDNVFYITADGVTIRGFGITGPINSPYAGIRLNGVKHCYIENNQISDKYNGAIPNPSSGSIPIVGNNSSSNVEIETRPESSDYNVLSNNIVSGNGISLLLRNSSENTIVNNSVSGSSYGIWIDSSSNNTLNENNVSYNKAGIYVKVSSGNMLNNNTAFNNSDSGINLWNSGENILSNSTVSNSNVCIVLHDSSENVLNNNTVSDSNYGTWLYSSSNNNKLNNNTALNNKVGIYVKASSGNTLTENIALNSTSGINLWDSVGNTLSSNIASNNEVSISLQNSSKNSLLNNTATSNNYGIWLGSSSNNKLDDNTASNNKFGIYLKNSSNNGLSGNWANSNSRYGIYLGSSRSNILTNNKVVSNSEYGFCLMDSGNSSIFNNFFNNTNNIYFQGTNPGTSLNTTMTQGTNIIDGSNLGGNFWATPKRNGFSQTRPDKNGDGICDVAYAVNKECIDYLPLAGSRITN